MSEYRVIQVAFEDNGLMVQYIDTAEDIRIFGKVVKQHSISISASHPDYREDLDDVYDRIQRLLTNVLEDFDASDPYNPDSEDEDEFKGMGDR